MELQTPRLRLPALTRLQLMRYLQAPAELEAELGVRVSRAVLTERARRALGRKIVRMETAAPADHDWYTYRLMVVREDAFGAGLIGFKGEPDADGWVEIGYGVDPAAQGRGYATEACRALIEWAFADPRCRAVGAVGVSDSNPASQRVLEKAGLRICRRGGGETDWIVEKAG